MRLSFYDNCDRSRNPYHNIAVEEYLLRHVGDDEVILYLWQNERTVVIGRNQNAWRECAVERLRADGGRLARRLSGGGAVYHGAGNLNFTFCVPRALYDVDRQISVIARAAASFGISVQKTGRNDITADGRKFSGNAFYKTDRAAYHHGTILISETFAAMGRYLDTAGSKVRAKGVASVPARVVNLADLNPAVTPESFRRAMREAFAESYGGNLRALTEKDFEEKEIAAREKFFASDEWRLGKQSRMTDEWEQKFSWGTLRLYFTVENGRIKAASIDSDGLASDFLARLPAALTGADYTRAVMAEKIAAMEAGDEEEENVLNDICAAMRKESSINN